MTSSARSKSAPFSRSIRLIVLLLSGTMVTGAGAQEPVPANTVSQAIESFSAKLEALRVHMGVAAVPMVEMSVSNAAPHDVYFQAENLLRKSARLAYDHIRVRVEVPERPGRVLGNADVLDLVRTADDALTRLLDEYAIKAGGEDASRPGASPSELYQSLRAANRQLAFMLDERVGATEAFMTLTHAVGYASELLAGFEGARRIPPAPDAPVGVTAEDALMAVFGCLQVLQQVYEALGFDSLEVKPGFADGAEIHSVDVLELASLLVARLDYLQEHLPGIDEPLPPVFPGRKFPADVVQRAGLLRSQLSILNEQVSRGGR